MYSIFLRINDRYQQFCLGDEVDIGIRTKSGGLSFYPWGGFTDTLTQPVKLQIPAYSDDTDWDPRRDKMMPTWTELQPNQYLVGDFNSGKVYILLPFQVVSTPCN